MNSNYLISSKKNSKDTEKEDSSSSVPLLDANKKDNDYQIILSDSENEINKDKMTAESLKKNQKWKIRNS